MSLGLSIVLSVLMPCLAWFFTTLQKSYFNYLTFKDDKAKYEISRRNMQTIQDLIDEGKDFDTVKKYVKRILKDLY